jgi:hypothetical protein
MVTHAPVPDSHPWHVPVQLAAEQQYPSLQVPLVHCAFCAHAPPASVSATHTPAPLQ